MELPGPLPQLAARGSILAARLTDHAAKHAQEEQLSQLYTTTSFVATVLGSLSSTLERYGSVMQLNTAIVAQLQKDCERDFDYIEKMLDQAADRARDSVLVPYIANYKAFADLAREMEELKDSVWVVLDAFTYLALRKLEKSQKLEPEQALDVKRHAEQLPMMQRMLERIESKMKTPLKADIPNTIETREVFMYEDKNGNMVKPIPRIIDDDARSIMSISSIRSDQFINTPEIYECYTLKQEPGRGPSRKSYRILGIRISEHFDDDDDESSNDFFTVIPQARTQSQLHEQIDGLAVDKPAHISYVAHTLSGLPARAREEIEFLVEDRERVTVNSTAGLERNWAVVDIERVSSPEPATPQKKRWALFGGRAKKRSSNNNSDEPRKEWILVLRGQTVSGDGEKLQKPDRFADPWRKRNVPRRRSVSRRRRSSTMNDGFVAAGAGADPVFPAPPPFFRRDKVRDLRSNRKALNEEAEEKIELLLVEGGAAAAGSE
ncbi:hypothetical protein PVAG01_04607 [Phlyctema vagabunda]|uniref:Uncharacterized protein n=1 Tax=Phlyctema vagabunda TaxID=108571 RepID=A0ABR4PHS3_9HELO